VAWQVTEVQKALKGADYPMDGAQLSELAKENGAEQALVDALAGVGRVDGPNGVMKELKGDLGGPTPDGRQERETKDVDGPSWQVTEVQKALKGADYPADGTQLSELAKRNGADDELVRALSGLREVDGPNGVMKELKASLGGPA
jgi:hypothetical protein